jgi:hypothetical protein
MALGLLAVSSPRGGQGAFALFRISISTCEKADLEQPEDYFAYRLDEWLEIYRGDEAKNNH